MPRKLAIIEIETGGDERLCGECSQLVCDGRNPVYCAAFGALERKPASFVRFRAPACIESTRLASLDRAVVEADDCPNCAVVRGGDSFPCNCFQCGKRILGDGPEAKARELLDREYGKDHPAARHNFTVTFRTTTHEHQVRELAKLLQSEGDRRAEDMRERTLACVERLKAASTPPYAAVLSGLDDAIRSLPLEPTK